MEDLKTAITGSKDKDSAPNLELTAGRISLGFKSRLPSGQTSLAKDVRANGPLAVIGPISRAVHEVRRPGSVQSAISIYIEKNKATDWDGLDIADFLEDVIKRLLTESNYTTNSKLLPGRVTLVGIVYESKAHPGIIAVRLEIESIPVFLN